MTRSARLKPVKAHSRIPLDRAEQIAAALEIDQGTFLRAVLEQRHPEVSWELITPKALATKSDNLAAQLEIILNAPLADLNGDQRRVLREVAAERAPSRRWLSVHELPLIEALRSHRAAEDEVDEILAFLERQSQA